MAEHPDSSSECEAIPEYRERLVQRLKAEAEQEEAEHPLLIPIRQAKKFYFKEHVSTGSQIQFQAARLAYYFLFADENGLFTPKSSSKPRFSLQRLETLLEVPDHSTEAGTEVLKRTFPGLSLEQLTMLIYHLYMFLNGTCYRHQQLALNTQYVTPQAAATFNRIRHGIGYLRTEALLRDSVDEYYDSGGYAETETVHQAINDRIMEHLDLLDLARKIHPVIYLKQLQDFEDFMAGKEGTFTSEKNATADFYGVGLRGKGKNNLTDPLDQELQVFYVRTASTQTGRSWEQIASSLDWLGTSALPDKQASFLFSNAKKHPWFEQFDNAERYFPDPTLIAAIANVEQDDLALGFAAHEAAIKASQPSLQA